MLTGKQIEDDLFLQIPAGKQIDDAGFLQVFVGKVIAEVGFLHCVVGRRRFIIVPMSDVIPQTATVIPVVSPSLTPQFAANPVKLLVAVADPIRWAALRELAGGEALSVQELAGRLRQDANLVSKHLRWLREAGAVVVAKAPGGDGRKSLHVVPANYLGRDAAGKPMIDFGVCALRFP
jgi:hypothetical protein